MDKWLFWADRATGKTWLLSHIANELCVLGYKVTYVSGTEEPITLNRNITHLYCSNEKNVDYTMAVLSEKAKIGLIDFLLIDDFELTNFKIISTFEIKCNIMVSINHFSNSDVLPHKVPLSVLGGVDKFLEIIPNGNNIKDYMFKKTFDSNKTINYGDIVNKYIRDKKIEQLI